MKFKKYLTYSVVASSLALTIMTSSDYGIANKVHATPVQIPAIQAPHAQVNAVQVSSQKTSAWAKPYVDAMNKAGLVPGSLTNADLTQKISRVEFAELITLYVNKAGITNAPSLHVEPFTDTNNQLVKKAAELGIVKGVGGNKFEPNKDIERQELATMGTRAEEVVDGYQNYDLVSTFKDGPQISSWARKGVAVMVKKNAIQGVGDGYFKPKDNATREQAIKIVSELADKKGLVKLDRVAISKPVVPKPTLSNPNPVAKSPYKQYGKAVETGSKQTGFRYGTAVLSGNIQHIHQGYKIPTEVPDYDNGTLVHVSTNPRSYTVIKLTVATQEEKGSDRYNVSFANAEVVLKSKLPSAEVDKILDYAAKNLTRDTDLEEKTFWVSGNRITVKGPMNSDSTHITIWKK